MAHQGVVAPFKLGDMATTMKLVEQLETGPKEVADYFRNLEPLADDGTNHSLGASGWPPLDAQRPSGLSCSTRTRLS